MPVVANGTPLSVRIASRQTVLAKQPVEDGAHAEAFGREQAVTREQVARVLVGHGERVTVHAIARAEVAFEVRGPEIIGVGGLDRHDAGMLVSGDAGGVSSPAPARASRSPAVLTAGTSTSGGAGQPVQQLLRPPARMLSPRVADQRRHLVRDVVRTPPRRPAAIAEPGPAALVESVQPFVARFATDAVPRAQSSAIVYRPTGDRE